MALKPKSKKAYDVQAFVAADAPITRMATFRKATENVTNRAVTDTPRHVCIASTTPIISILGGTSDEGRRYGLYQRHIFAMPLTNAEKGDKKCVIITEGYMTGFWLL